MEKRCIWTSSNDTCIWKFPNENLYFIHYQVKHLFITLSYSISTILYFCACLHNLDMLTYSFYAVLICSWFWDKFSYMPSWPRSHGIPLCLRLIWTLSPVSEVFGWQVYVTRPDLEIDGWCLEALHVIKWLYSSCTYVLCYIFMFIMGIEDTAHSSEKYSWFILTGLVSSVL